MTKPEHAQLELDRFLPYRLSVLSNRVSQDIAQLYQERFDLNITEWRVIAVLGRYPNISANEVADRTAMDKVAVSRAVSSLLKSKRIKRKMDREDKRRSVLSLSAKGLVIFDEVTPLAKAYEQRLLSALPIEQREALLRILDLLEREELAIGASLR